MPATPLHLTGSLRIEQGASYQFTVNLKDQYGVPFDLTGYTGSAQLRHNYADATPSASLTCLVDSPSSSGSITLSLAPSSSMSVTACKYVWDMEITSGSAVYRIFEGIAQITPNVTR